jgi:uncharacterized protein YecE (DUF72 family)
MGRAYIGISGWTYAGWHRLFYPEGLPARHELAFATLQFNAIEINHTDSGRRIQHVFEVRHESFMGDDFIDLLRDHRIPLVFSDAAADWPYAEDVTADIVYLRLHGAEEIYASAYDAASLDRWARKLRAWLRGTERTVAMHTYSSTTTPRCTHPSMP